MALKCGNQKTSALLERADVGKDRLSLILFGECVITFGTGSADALVKTGKVNPVFAYVNGFLIARTDFTSKREDIRKDVAVLVVIADFYLRIL